MPDAMDLNNSTLKSLPIDAPKYDRGGVSVGMTKHQAAAVWGAPDRCVKFENVIWC